MEFLPKLPSPMSPIIFPSVFPAAQPGLYLPQYTQGSPATPSFPTAFPFPDVASHDPTFNFAQLLESQMQQQQQQQQQQQRQQLRKFSDFSVEKLLDLPSSSATTPATPHSERSSPVFCFDAISCGTASPSCSTSSTSQWSAHEHSPRSYTAATPPALAGTPDSNAENVKSNDSIRVINRKIRKARKNRTVFEPVQLEFLEKMFKSTQYLVAADRKIVSDELGLDESQVKIWFQNRRSKWRRSTVTSSHSDYSHGDCDDERIDVDVC